MDKNNPAIVIEDLILAEMLKLIDELRAEKKKEKDKKD